MFKKDQARQNSNTKSRTSTNNTQVTAASSSSKSTNDVIVGSSESQELSPLMESGRITSQSNSQTYSRSSTRNSPDRDVWDGQIDSPAVLLGVPYPNIQPIVTSKISIFSGVGVIEIFWQTISVHR